MSTELEIALLEDGEIVLREADGDAEPLVRIRFSGEVEDMLGNELVGVAEAMIDAATAYLGDAEGSEEIEAVEAAPVIH